MRCIILWTRAPAPRAADLDADPASSVPLRIPRCARACEPLVFAAPAVKDRMPSGLTACIAGITTLPEIERTRNGVARMKALDMRTINVN